MEIRNMIRSHQVLLSQIAKDTMTLRATRAPEAPESIFSIDTSGASILDQLAPRNARAVEMATQPSLQATILSSEVYKKTLARALSPSNDNDSTADDNTIVGVESSNPHVEEDGQPGKIAVLDSWPPSVKAHGHLSNTIPRQAAIADCIDFSALNAEALSGHTAQSPEEISFKRSDVIVNIQRQDPTAMREYWGKDGNAIWSGQVKRPNRALGFPGQFDESMVCLRYPLRHGILVIAKRDIDSSASIDLNARQGSMIEIKVSPALLAIEPPS
jgi:hypothetical protein